MSAVLPCFVLAEQFYPDPATTGAERLSRAVLEEALATYARGVRTPARTGLLTALEQAHAEAGAWFASEDVSWPFSFVNVCDTLHLDAGRIRRVLVGPGIEQQVFLLMQRVTHPVAARRVYRKRV